MQEITWPRWDHTVVRRTQRPGNKKAPFRLEAGRVSVDRSVTGLIIDLQTTITSARMAFMGMRRLSDSWPARVERDGGCLPRRCSGSCGKTPKRQRGARVMFPSEPGDPLYVFLLLPLSPGQSEKQYRRDRELVLQTHCLIAKLHCPEAKNIIGLATETSFDNGGRSEDLLYYDASEWTAEDEERARQLQTETGWLRNLERSEGTEYQFPPLPVSGTRVQARRIRAKGSERNGPCPCGSGKKLKKCHGQ